MGGDCCGGESLPAAQHALNDLHLNTLSNNGAQAADPKSHQEAAKELEAFIKKRIDLFEQYNSRHIAEVCSVTSKYKTLARSCVSAVRHF